MVTIYLIRHGEIETGSQHRFVGQTDLSLTDKGREQISNLGEYLKHYSIEKIFCSPLLRCQQSAGIIGTFLPVPVEVVDNLAEINLGEWDGLTKEEVQNCFPGQYEARGNDLVRFCPSRGESFFDLYQRVWPAFKKIASSGPSRLAVVAHAGVNRVLLSQAMGIQLVDIFNIKQEYGCSNVLHYEQGVFRVESVNFFPVQLICNNSSE